MGKRLPFYMVYQMPFADEEERMIRRDYEYMKSAYPDAARRLIPYIEEECDRLAYEGSMLFDEYPDQLSLRLMCRRICGRAAQEMKETGPWLENLVQVMTYQELCQRRMEHRSIQKRFWQISNEA